MSYNHQDIEKKWQKYWEENNTFKTPNPGDKNFDETKPKYYVLDMFPYPSGAGLHVGHPEGYTANDIIARYFHAKGYNVLHPMGWDAFGLPAENYAIKTGTHPKITTEKNINRFRQQIKSLGISYDWDREINTTDPKYYKWTQWIFLKMFEHGLAYEQNLPINYCPSCKTGLANEEVLKDGTCERCGTKVEKKPIRQWVLAITKYADRLAKDVDKLDWPEGIKDMQKNWIGRSEGTEFKMDVIRKRSEENSEEFRRDENLNNKKNEVCISDLVRVGLNCPANTSFRNKNNQKIVKINRKKHFANHINGYVVNNGKKINFDSKKILKHFKSKSLKEFRYRKNLLGSVYAVLDKIDFDDRGIGYFIVGKIIVKVVLGKQANGNYFIKSFYKADKHTKAYQKLLSQEEYEKLGEISVYTTRIDTVFGMSYAVIAPEHKDIEKFIQPEQKQACEKYIQEAKNKSDLDRTADNKEKTGVFTGSYVINPYNGEIVPLWIADYVLGHYGTGAVMAVPAHDERDFDFAKKYNLPIKQVIVPKDLTNKKNESCSPNGVEPGLVPAKLSSKLDIIQKLKKIKRKRHKIDLKNYYKVIIFSGKKIIIDGKKLKNHFSKKNLKEFRYRINQFDTIVLNLDKIVWENDTIGYLRIGNKIFRVVFEKCSADNTFLLKTFYVSTNYTKFLEQTLLKLPFTDYGILVNSGDFTGLTSEQAKEKLTNYAEEKGFGHKKINYKLRDWIFSRQRYWGEPIPLIHLNIEDLKKLPHITEEELKIVNQKIENYLNEKMRGVPPAKQEWVAPLGNTTQPSFKLDDIQKIKKIKRKKARKFNLKSVFLKKDINGKEIRVSGQYLLEHFKNKKDTEKHKRLRYAKSIIENIHNLLFIGNYGIIIIDDKVWLVVFDQVSNNVFNLKTYYELKRFTKFLNTAYILKRPEKDGENVPESAKCKHTGLVRELVIGGKVFSKIYDGLESKIVCDYRLPLELPEVEKYEPAGDGQSPLARIDDWVNIKLADNLTGKRETNTMPQWGGSCWYHLRYMDPHNDNQLVAPEIERYWGSVDSYVGGAEHAVLHLLYARFWHKFLYDIGVVSTDEPFYRLRNQGLILAYAYQRKNGGLVAVDMVEEKDGKYYHKETGEELEKVIAKMSKSLKNVVNPDDIIKEYGADALRLYEMYMADFKDAAPWDTKGIVGVKRFLDKVARYFIEKQPKYAENDKEAIRLLHKSIKKISEDIENYKFNTAIAQLMILLNYGIPKDEELAKQWKETFIKLLHPFAPHLAEEIYQNYLDLENKKDSIFNESWPEYDENLAKDDMITIAVQVMGKLRGTIQVPTDATKDEILEKAKQEPNVKKWIDGKTIVKEIYVPGKIVNLVIK